MQMDIKIPSQYIMIDLFTDDSTKNVNNMSSMLLSDNKPINEPIICKNGILPNTEYFRISTNGNQIILSPGICIMNNILIEVLKEKYLNLNNSKSCIYSDDVIPQLNGDYKVSLCMRYSPDTSNKDAYIGLIYNELLYMQNEQDLIVFGFIKFNINDNIYLVNGVEYNNHDKNIFRNIPISVIDGGNINDPIIL